MRFVAIIDEIDEETVRVELNRQVVHLPRSWVPERAREGDRLVADLVVEKAAPVTSTLHNGDDGSDIEL